MRVVTLEEHFVIPSLIESHSLSNQHHEQLPAKIRERLADLDDARLEAMDKGHVSVQVLSAAAPGADQLTGEEGIQFARRTNDTLHAAVKRHPNRLAGFAHLPMQTPAAAADELTRAVTDLEFHGALINGTTSGLFLDDPSFAPLLARAEALDVPLYLHPAMPPEAVRKAYYSGLPGNLGSMLSMAGFGWHSEVAIHILRLVLSGTFDRHPRLKIIIGHMGEMLPFMLERSEQVFSSQKEPIGVKEAILKHVWITTSGFFTIPPFLNALQTFGADRILFSVDYPFSDTEKGWEYLRSLPVSPTDLRKIAASNADQLLRLV